MAFCFQQRNKISSQVVNAKGFRLAFSFFCQRDDSMHHRSANLLQHQNMKIEQAKAALIG